MQDGAAEIANPVTYLINLSLTVSEVSTALKTTTPLTTEKGTSSNVDSTTNFQATTPAATTTATTSTKELVTTTPMATKTTGETSTTLGDKNICIFLFKFKEMTIYPAIVLNLFLCNNNIKAGTHINMSFDGLVYILWVIFYMRQCYLLFILCWEYFKM